MTYPVEEERQFPTGCYVCPATGSEVLLEQNVPRPWVQWPVRVLCKTCGQEHVIEYNDVRQVEPVFGHE